MINKEKIMKTININELDFDPTDVEVVGKGTKVAALKDMGFGNTDFDNLEDLYTNEYFKDTPEWLDGDALADVAEWEDIEGGF
jgi:hypothetical protein